MHPFFPDREPAPGQGIAGTLDFLAALHHREARDCSIITMPNMRWWNSQNKTKEQKAHIIDRAQTLQAGIRMSYEDKCTHTEKIIRRSLETPGNWALSYSGGKDSTVLSHYMSFGLGLKVPHVMSNTRMEYPETIKQVNAWFHRLRAEDIECHTIFPDKRPGEVWKTYGLPLWSKMVAYKYRKFRESPKGVVSKGVPDNLALQFHTAKATGLRITDQCCEQLKKQPLEAWDKKQKVTGNFTGVRCSESRARRLAWIMKGSLYQASTHHNNWISNPLAFWTSADVMRYLKDNDILPLAPDTPSGGSGCMTCMFGCHLNPGQQNTLQDLKTRNPAMWETALDKWGYREALDILGIPYE